MSVVCLSVHDASRQHAILHGLMTAAESCLPVSQGICPFCVGHLIPALPYANTPCAAVEVLAVVSKVSQTAPQVLKS